MAGHGATALLAGAAGWLLHAAGPAPPRAPELPAATGTLQPGTVVTTQVGDRPLIAVSSHGTVTLRVEQQPLEWVLDEIARQSGGSDVRQRARATTIAAPGDAAGPSAADCPLARIVAPAQVAQVLQRIERGSEAERYDGLLHARTDGIAVPDPLLKTLFETDASEQVRLLAFQNYLEPRSGSIQAMRGALEAALYVPSGAIQREARRRLDELLEGERIDAASGQKADP